MLCCWELDAGRFYGQADKPGQLGRVLLSVLGVVRWPA